MRYRAVISYLGARFVGWQRQTNGLSVQEVLESALFKVCKTEIAVTASGRTDAGVNAEGQTVHFDAETSIPCDKIPFAVNAELPPDVSMLFCEQAADDFNARFSAKKKTYRYGIYLSRHRLPLQETTRTHVVQPLNLNGMRKAAEYIKGTHDFKCFEASGSVIKNTVRTVYDLTVDVNFLNNGRLCDAQDSAQKIAESQDIVFDAELDITVTGNGFLYNMVRIIAGTLIYVGLNKINPEDVKNIIASGDRTLAGKTMPAKGLCLVCVEYES